MCKHILNAQVSIRAQCCKKWFDCSQCHREESDHEIAKSDEIVFACKKCKKCFRKYMSQFEESDEYCPHCDNHYYLDAVTPQQKMVLNVDHNTDMDVFDPRTRKAKGVFDGQYFEQ
ncbi:hypothetical protein CYY_003077 [Polysphondylium violaceum]|uniref:CHY-type domain-containing protein n=1 Tax=Polysphondylium violaceum TaxID=133409 RepID=A0A8J4Q0I5_9MYCE|nr:hypothetical protein CYY_003077 [Polysphondylium violaceum]